jgi:general secretion pathway protein G
MAFGTKSKRTPETAVQSRPRNFTRNVNRPCGVRGFTLIEVLIVVVILGILAAIVLPNYTSATSQANRDTLLAITQTLRTQIAFYKLQHGDALPDLTANGGNNWPLFTQPSTFLGQNVGPYMQTVPTNCVNGMSTVLNGNGTGPAPFHCGYIYDFNSGAGTGNIWGTDTDGVTLVTQ